MSSFSKHIIQCSRWPIVCSIEDASMLMGTNLDILVVEDFVLFKDQPDKSLIKDYKNKFELD